MFRSFAVRRGSGVSDRAVRPIQADWWSRQHGCLHGAPPTLLMRDKTHVKSLFVP